MAVTYGTVALSSGVVSSLSVNLATTNAGDLNILVVSANGTGTNIQPNIATPSGWTQIGVATKAGTPQHEIAAFYRFFVSGDASSVTVSIGAAGGGNLAIAPMSFSAGMIDTTTPIATGEKSFVNTASGTPAVTSAITLGGTRYVVSVFGNKSGATWSAATDGNVHDTIQLQGKVSSAASVAICQSGTTTSSGAARSLTSSVSTTINDVGIFALAPATAFPLAADFTGSGSLSVSLTPSVPLTASFTGSGTAAASLAPSAPVAAGFAGSGSLSVSLTPSVALAAPFTGAGAAAVSLAPSAPLTAPFSGSGSASVALAPSVPVPAAYAGAGALAVALAPNVSLPASFAGSGALSVDLTRVVVAPEELVVTVAVPASVAKPTYAIAASPQPTYATAASAAATYTVTIGSES